VRVAPPSIAVQSLGRDLIDSEMPKTIQEIASKK
jgi:hypothetical protein